VKNDERDAVGLADLLRMGRLPRRGSRRRRSASCARADSLRQLMAALADEVSVMEQVTGDLLAGHGGYHALQGLPAPAGARSGRCRGDRRHPPLSRPRAAGLPDRADPCHRELDVKVSRGHVTKQGPRILRWAVTEAIQQQPAGTRAHEVKDSVIARRGKEARNIAKVAAARELLRDVFYAMRGDRARRSQTWAGRLAGVEATGLPSATVTSALSPGAAASDVPKSSTIGIPCNQADL
jgi:hypothetical protein